MKKFIPFLLLILIIASCVKFDKLGMPTWESEYQINILNDTYDVNQIADFDSALYVQNNVLRFRTSLADSVYYDDVTIQHPMAKHVSISLNSLSDDISQLNGMQTIVPTFSIQPLQEDVPNYDEFQEITFDTAEIKFTITNNTDIYMGNYPDDPLMLSLINRNTGEMFFQFIVEGNIPPHSVHTSVLDFAGYTFPNSLTLELSGGSIGSNGETITVDTSQQIDIGIELLDFKIRHVIAHIPYQELSEQTITQDLSIVFPQIIGDFSLASNSSINFKISSPIPARSVIKLVSVGINGEKDTLKVNGSIPTIYNISGITDTTFYSSNSNLNDLLTLLPERFDMIINPAVGDTTDTIYSISNTDMTKMGITIDTDMNLDANCWVVPRNEDKPKITATNVEDFDKNKFEGFVNGGIKLNFDNRLGSEVGLDLLASNNRENLDNFDKIIHPDTTDVTIFSIPVIVSGKDSIDFVIKKKDLEVFVPDSVYIVPRLKLISDESSPLQNGIDVRAKVHMKIRVSKDLLPSGN